MGKLEVICGPMFSGKSEELLRRLKRAQIAKQSFILYKPTIDNRYSETHVVTHSGIEMKCHVISSALRRCRRRRHHCDRRSAVPRRKYAKYSRSFGKEWQACNRRWARHGL